MKRLLIRFFILLLTFTCLSYAICFEKEDEEKHIFHVHVYEMSAAGYGNCSECGQPLAMQGYIYEPTCTSEGQAEIACENPACSMYLSALGYTAPALGHDYVDKVTKQPTCTESGEVYHLCSRCENSYTSSIAPTGHSYKETVVTKATCTKAGLLSYECSTCGDSYTKDVAALGHNYKSKVTKEATCTQEGITTYTCSRCDDKYTKKIEALGHDIEYEEVEATCTADGYKKGVCKRCGDEVNEILPALGHDVKEYKTVKEPTCIEDGQIEGVCERCGEKLSDVLLRLGHKYPAEWTREKEPTMFEYGLEYKICSVCGQRIEQLIPMKEKTPVYVGGGAVVLAAAGIFLYLRKYGKHAKKVLEETEKEGIEPEFEDKSILCASTDESLLKTIKSKKFLEVTTCEKQEIEEQAQEAGADLLIADVLEQQDLDTLLKLKDETLPEQKIALVVGEEFYNENKNKLDSFKQDKTIVNYVHFNAKDYDILVKLILPILKPNLKSDEALANIGAVADALGIPGISNVIDVYVNGRDIKSTIEEGELSVSSTATVIGDIASILGLDAVASVAGLVDDVDSIKAAVDKEAGAYERKYGVEGAKDIVDVVSDIVNKE